MNLRPLAALALLGLLAFACGGLVQDVSKGAGNTDREVNSKLGHDTTRGDRDGGGPAAAPDGGDAGQISL